MNDWWTSVKRVLVSGAKHFVRSGVVSAATVLVMTVTLGIIGSMIFVSAILGSTLHAIEDKVDVNVYFTTDADQQSIDALAQKLRQLPEVAQVTYTSREDALAQFRERHANDQLTLQALDELGDNPLGASLAVKAKDPSQYQGIADLLTNDSALSAGSSSIIDHVNYYENKTVIDRLTAVIAATERAGAAIVLVFAIASAIIAIATIRIAIYASREEIGVMRLVGASNWYIRGPFIVAGMMGGALAAVIALILFYPSTWYVGSSLSNWLGGFDLFSYYIGNFGWIFLTLLGTGILLGAIASFLAVRRYLKV